MYALRKKSCWDFVSGAGTGGTIMGIANFMEKTHRSGRVVRVVPEEGDGRHGIQGINDGGDFLLSESSKLQRLHVSTRESIEAAKEFSRTHGLMVGISSGANLVAARRHVRETGNVVVTVLCDRGERYISIFQKS